MVDFPEGYDDYKKADRVAEDVVDTMKKAGIEVTEADALKQLAIKDANMGITDGMDADEVDNYLDEFTEALENVAEKDDALEDRIEGASDKPIDGAGKNPGKGKVNNGS